MVARHQAKEFVWKVPGHPVASRRCKCHEKEEFTKHMTGGYIASHGGVILDPVVFINKDARG